MFTVDETLACPAVKHAALGQYETRYLEPGPEEPGQREVRRRLPKKYGGKLPSFYGAQSYDGIMLIDSAVRAVKGNLADKKGMIAAMRKANFNSVRGKFTYNLNHFPIENFYLLKAVAGATPTADPVMEIQKTVFKNYKDSYCQGLQDEVVAAPAAATIKGRASAPFFIAMNLVLIAEQTLNGLQLGVMLFLMAAGLTLVFGIMNLVNLAHGSLYMVGAYLATYFYAGDRLLPARRRCSASPARWWSAWSWSSSRCARSTSATTSTRCSRPSA